MARAAYLSRAPCIDKPQSCNFEKPSTDSRNFDKGVPMCMPSEHLGLWILIEGTVRDSIITAHTSHLGMRLDMTDTEEPGGGTGE